MTPMIATWLIFAWATFIFICGYGTGRLIGYYAGRDKAMKEMGWKTLDLKNPVIHIDLDSQN